MTSFLSEVEAFLVKHRVTAERVGVGAMGDQRFVSLLRQGRRPRTDTVDRVREWMRLYEASHPVAVEQPTGELRTALLSCTPERIPAPAIKPWAASAPAEPLPAGCVAVGRKIEFDLWRATLSGNVLKRMHFRQQHDHQALLRYEVIAAALAMRPDRPFAWARVTFWRLMPRTLDYDNLVFGFKPLLDCLTTPFEREMKKKPRHVIASMGNYMGLSFIVDDKPQVCLTAYHQVQTKGDRVGRTSVRIEELLQASDLAVERAA